MPRNWSGNVQIQLGTGFWLLLCLIAFALIAWRLGWFREGKLANMLSYSVTGDRSLVASKN